MTSILLTGARAPVTLDLARRFHSAGHQVVTADSVRFPLTAFSRLRHRHAALPRAVDDPDLYIEAINRLIDKYDIELIIPTCEEVFHLARHREWLACELFTSSFDVLHRLHHKFEFTKIATTANARAPETHLLTTIESLERFRSESSDWVFKPAYSRFAATTLVGPKSWQLKRIRPTISQPWVAQRKIGGQEISTTSVCRNGNLLAHVAYQSRYRAGVGAGIYLEALELDACEVYVRELAGKLNFTGQLGLDFIQESDGSLFSIEANPRATNGVCFFDQDEHIVNTFLQSTSTFVRPPSPPAMMVGFAMPYWGLASAVRNGELLRFPADCVRGRDIVFRIRDPLPAMTVPLSLAEFVWRAVREGKSLLHATTFDIEWNGETR